MNELSSKDAQRMTAVDHATHAIKLLEVVERLLAANCYQDVGPGWKGVAEEAAILRRTVVINRLDVINLCCLEKHYTEEALKTFEDEAHLAYRQSGPEERR